ncbi:MAG: outer membrane beta-barrel protein [Bacteroidota bacterium]
MKRKDLSYASRYLIVAAFLLLASAGNAQRKGPPKSTGLEAFLQTQFWLGLRFGTNISTINVEEQYSGLSPINYDPDLLRKNYENFKMPGAQVGLEMNLYHKGFSISFQPSYRVNRYRYSSTLNYQRVDETPAFEARYDIKQQLSTLELPLVLKYDFIRKGKIRPFVMAGAFHARILGAQKEFEISEVDFDNTNSIESNTGSIIVGTKDHFQPFSGLIGGIGVNLDYWNIRTVFEIGYRHSLTQATIGNSRQEQLTSLGEAEDRLAIHDLNASLSFVFPFRFISSGLRAY